MGHAQGMKRQVWSGQAMGVRAKQPPHSGPRAPTSSGAPGSQEPLHRAPQHRRKEGAPPPLHGRCSLSPSVQTTLPLKHLSMLSPSPPPITDFSFPLSGSGYKNPQGRFDSQ